mmetsp:Transcript_5641/g.14292  ORF Transcript_5641/g.14292 Transcript_5641/m.14292 type:complete len:286 (-) Transcript_5641:745-1602(-)
MLRNGGGALVLQVLLQLLLESSSSPCAALGSFHTGLLGSCTHPERAGTSCTSLPLAPPSSLENDAVCQDGVLRLAGGIDYSKFDALEDDESAEIERSESREKTIEDIATQSDLQAVLAGASQSIKETTNGKDSFAQRVMQEVEEDEDPEWLTVLAAMYYANGVENKTDALLIRALRLNPSYLPALLFRGRFLACNRGELEEAKKLLTSAVEADPDNEEAKDALAQILSLRSGGEEGLKLGLSKCRQEMQGHIVRITAGIEKLQPPGLSLRNNSTPIPNTNFNSRP